MLFMKSRFKSVFLSVLFCMSVGSGFAMEQDDTASTQDGNGQDDAPASWFSNVLNGLATYELPNPEAAQQLFDGAIEQARNYGQTALPAVLAYAQQVQEILLARVQQVAVPAEEQADEFTGEPTESAANPIIDENLGVPA